MIEQPVMVRVDYRSKMEELCFLHCFGGRTPSVSTVAKNNSYNTAAPHSDFRVNGQLLLNNPTHDVAKWVLTLIRL